MPDPVELCQSPLGVAPKRLYAIDVGTARREIPVNFAVSVAVKSIEKYRINLSKFGLRNL